MGFINDLAYRFSGANRGKKWDLFLKAINPQPDQTILDVGFSEQEYSDTDNFLEKHYPYQAQITALGIDVPDKFAQRYPRVKAVHYGGRDFPFADKSFDLVWSNAVIEHVGYREAQLHFLKEICRVGKRIWLTTPNRHFPVEVHTRIPILHWFGKGVFDPVVRLFGMDWAAGPQLVLLTKKEMFSLLDDAGVARDQVQITTNRLFGFELDYVFIIDLT